jgi:hypothetical protein
MYVTDTETRRLLVAERHAQLAHAARAVHVTKAGFPAREVRSRRMRLRRIAAALVVTTAVLAAPAAAASTLDINATFPEHFGGPRNSPFTCPPSSFPTLCASGELVGVGHADELIEFGACGAGCDVRTITLEDGSSLVLRETNVVPFAGETPGSSGDAPGHLVSYGNPFMNVRTDVVAGGTGRFAGASGGLTMNVVVAGGIAVVSIAGTITLP